MKFIKITAAALILASVMATTACNDLEQPPTNQYNDSNFWKDKNAQDMVNTAYTQVYNDGCYWGDEELSDNLYNGYRVTDSHLIRRGIATPGTGRFGWDGWWGGIRSCHTFLQHADEIKDSEQAKIDRLKAEARVLRDMIYFRLTSLYGDIPFFMENPTLQWASTCKRTSHAEVIRTITADIEECIAALPTVQTLPAAERGRLTQGAAAMLLARIALMESDWEAVASWTSRIIDGEFGNYALFPSYEGLFKEENEYNQEVILDCGMVAGNPGRTWNQYAHMKPPSLRADYVNWCPTQSLVDTYLTMGGYRIDEPGADYDPQNPYSNRDPRLAATVVYDKSQLYDPSTGNTHTIYIDARSKVTADNVSTSTSPGASRTYTGYYPRKCFSPVAGETDYKSGLNLIMMRYADVLLMYAEAMNELQRMNSEVWDKTIGAIRARAGFTSEKALKMPQGDLRKVIRDERRVELALEGLRWWDIKRWKAGTEYLNGPVKGCTFVGGPAVLDTYKFNENRDYLWAIPLSETDFNPNLSQNPGYSN